MTIKITSWNAVIFHREMTESALFRNDLQALRSQQFMHLVQIGVRVLILILIKLRNFEDQDCSLSIAVKRSIQTLAMMVVPDMLSTPKVLIKFSINSKKQTNKIKKYPALSTFTNCLVPNPPPPQGEHGRYLLPREQYPGVCSEAKNLGDKN